MIKINTLAIDIGHNVKYDVGAVAIKREDDLNRLVGEELISRCRNAGINVVNCTPADCVSLNDSLTKRVEVANNSRADFYISIHHNACPGGEGAEALCITGGESERVGKIILNEIGKLGFRNRGIKDRRNLFVINNTVMPALIIECAFCDSQRDMANYDCVKMSNSIFKGIINAFEITAKSVNTDSGPLYHTVTRGETLWWVSRNYGVTIGEIVKLNGIKDKNLIYIGQRIRIK
jgi:N-acetylmuramoyl-L-alanine amidase